MIDEEEEGEEISFAELAPAIEFACWTAVVLAPLLRLVNGAAVTNDQWWFQVSLFSAAIIGACSLRIYQMLLRRRTR